MYEPSSTTPIQTSVVILHDFFMGNFDVKGLGTAGEELDIYDVYTDQAYTWAESQLRERGFSQEQITYLRDHHEEAENTPIYNEYYQLREQFNRKVLAAAAASI
jgi:hypothetical protein